MTINEIAEMAGVSRTTVSRYLNNGYVSKEKMEKIKAVIDKTGYQPSRQAQMLRTKRTNLIAVILPKINSDSISRMVEGISSVLNRAGYELILTNTNNKEQDELKYLRLFAANGSVDGVILIGTILTKEHRELLANYSLPVVVLGQNVDFCSCVYYDDYNACKKLASSLVSTGKNFAYIGVTEKDEAVGHLRKQGFMDALAEAGIRTDSVQVAESAFRMDSGYDACRELLKKESLPDTIFCATDTIAIGAMLYLREQGIRVPEQIQITGIGNSEKAHVVLPKLTTVHYYYRTSGKETARILLGLLSGRETATRAIKMGYKIIENESVR